MIATTIDSYELARDLVLDRLKEAHSYAHEAASGSLSLGAASFSPQDFSTLQAREQAMLIRTWRAVQSNLKWHLQLVP